eukprot:TRINITY_DN251_c4_g1_i1.p1 TRINITY_DN251_c4_g1~~TRINITY_DN251_c4_g1_i1.p1  ORF type:complete len:800 (-),score=170.09 TRINITY_DN251_c4_g1_i1:206-2605(-)
MHHHHSTLFAIAVHFALVLTLSTVHCVRDASAPSGEIQRLKDTLTNAGFSTTTFQIPETICFKRGSSRTLPRVLIGGNVHGLEPSVSQSLLAFLNNVSGENTEYEAAKLIEVCVIPGVFDEVVQRRKSAHSILHNCEASVSLRREITDLGNQLQPAALVWLTSSCEGLSVGIGKWDDIDFAPGGVDVRRLDEIHFSIPILPGHASMRLLRFTSVLGIADIQRQDEKSDPCCAERNHPLSKKETEVIASRALKNLSFILKGLAGALGKTEIPPSSSTNSNVGNRNNDADRTENRSPLETQRQPPPVPKQGFQPRPDGEVDEARWKDFPMESLDDATNFKFLDHETNKSSSATEGDSNTRANDPSAGESASPMPAGERTAKAGASFQKDDFILNEGDHDANEELMGPNKMRPFEHDEELDHRLSVVRKFKSENPNLFPDEGQPTPSLTKQFSDKTQREPLMEQDSTTEKPKALKEHRSYDEKEPHFAPAAHHDVTKDGHDDTYHDYDDNYTQDMRFHRIGSNSRRNRDGKSVSSSISQLNSSSSVPLVERARDVRVGDRRQDEMSDSWMHLSNKARENADVIADEATPMLMELGSSKRQSEEGKQHPKEIRPIPDDSLEDVFPSTPKKEERTDAIDKTASSSPRPTSTTTPPFETEKKKNDDVGHAHGFVESGTKGHNDSPAETPSIMSPVVTAPPLPTSDSLSTEDVVSTSPSYSHPYVLFMVSCGLLFAVAYCLYVVYGRAQIKSSHHSDQDALSGTRAGEDIESWNGQEGDFSGKPPFVGSEEFIDAAVTFRKGNRRD